MKVQQKFFTLLIATTGILFASFDHKIEAATHLRVCTPGFENGVVNVRSGPGINYSIVAEVFNGQDLFYGFQGMHTDVNAKPPKDKFGYYWVEVYSPNNSSLNGYMRADFLGCSPRSLQDSLVREYS